MIQIAPQMRILVAIEAVDGRKGIDSLARLCQEKLQEDPFSGCLFVFRSRRGTSIRILAYDGQGFWLAQKRLSKGRFVWWPSGKEPTRRLQAHQAQLLLAAGNPETEAAPVWRRVSCVKKLQWATCVPHWALAYCGVCRRSGDTGAEPLPPRRSPSSGSSSREHPGSQPASAVGETVRGLGMEAGQRRAARHGLPRS